MESCGILEAAKILKVTDKTIRNYINRGFLKPEKWNGAWRISREEIEELFRKKYGKKLMKNQVDMSHNSDQILVEKSEFEVQQQQLGKLVVTEAVERELRAEIRSMIERNAQLEASSASGWTEARAVKKELEKAREELRIAKEREKQVKQDVNWLRREKKEIQITAQKSANTIQKLREENQRLLDLLYQRAVGLASVDTENKTRV